MSIRVIDIAMLPNQSQEASQMQNAEHNRAMAGQQNVTQHVQKQAEDNSRKTVKTTEKDERMNHFDAKEKGSNEYQQRGKKKKNTSDEKEKDHKSGSGHHFDITI
ncbi:MAG: hypothetical protein PUB10_09550 [Clostridiales bacterium]|nr:hypothetical protein [Clostridiales bacterium]